MEQMFVGGTCAVCECMLLHGLYGQEIVQFSCGHEVHETCLENGFGDDDEDVFCPECDAPLNPVSSDDEEDEEDDEDYESSTYLHEATFTTTETIMAELTSEDAVVAVLGPVGAGKSFFVRSATGDESIKVGKRLEPAIDEFSAHRTEIDGHSVVLIDTVGFDDTHQSHMDVLRTLAIWLAEMDIKDMHLAGLIYVHDAKSSQSFSASERNLRVLKRLAGESAPKKVVFVTNDGGESSFSTDEAEAAVLTRSSNVHDHSRKRGIKMERFAGSGHDARRILRSIIGQHNGASLNSRQESVDDLSSLQQVHNSSWTRDTHEITQFRIEFEDMLRSIRVEISSPKFQKSLWLDEQREEQDYRFPVLEQQHDVLDELELEDSSSSCSSSIEEFTQSDDTSHMDFECENSDTAPEKEYSVWTTAIIRLWEILQRAPSIHAETEEEGEFNEETYLHIPCSFPLSLDEPPALSDTLISQYPYSPTIQQENETWAVRLPWRFRPRLARIASDGDLYLKQHPDWFLFVSLMFFYLCLNVLVFGFYFWRRNHTAAEVGVGVW